MRQEFTKAVKLAAWNRCQGYCEGGCTSKLYPGRFEYHHDKEDTFGGAPTLENCLVLCVACHSKITRKRAAAIAKSNRLRDRHIGIKKRPSRPMPGSKASGIRKHMNGVVAKWDIPAE